MRTNLLLLGTAFSTINFFDTGYRLPGNSITISNYISPGNPPGTNTVDFNSTAVSLAAGANVSLVTNGNTLQIGAAVDGTNAWLQGGNAGTTAGANVAGTTDSQPLELKVNNQRAAR